MIQNISSLQTSSAVKKKIMKIIFYLSITVLFIYSCNGNKTNQQETIVTNITESSVSDISIKKATHFSVEFHENYKLVSVINPGKGSEKTFRYLLVNKGTQAPDINADAIIQVPIERMVCFSTTHLPLLEYLGKADRLVGFPNTDYISSDEIRKLVQEGKVKDLGSDMDVNVEELLVLQPDIVMAYSMGDHTNQFQLIQRGGIPVVYNADFMENNPLGRAEWIKFMALFFNEEEKADSIFNAIEERYKSLKSLVENVEKKPTVFCGILYGESWIMPGSRNFGAQFFKDAGAKYLWDDNDEEGNIRFSFEHVYEKAHDADFWIGVGSYSNLREMQKTDKRYAVFKAFKDRNIFNYNAKMGPSGGNAYFELGYLRPDMILSDLIKIFHPEKLSEEPFYFHQSLK